MSAPIAPSCFDPDCRACPRLAEFLDEVRVQHPDYHARPVAPFGDSAPHLLIVGLAPGMHGANRSGRPFTGDHAGILLYQTLHQFGYASAPQSLSADDGLQLIACRITNAVKCLPPANKPEPAEIRACNRFLAAEVAGLPSHASILALGLIAHQAVLRALGLKLKDYPFSHASDYRLPDGRRLVSSYHCSRYNTQTRRLTPEMFAAVFAQIQSTP
jgi:uracil-DNA glycosylase family 4